jgi:hypothetical protein
MTLKRALTIGVPAMLATAVFVSSLASGTGVARQRSVLHAEEVTAVEPMPSSILSDGVRALTSEWDRRLNAWVARVDPTGLSNEELVATMDMITGSLTSTTRGDDWWLATHELMVRRGFLCSLLPEGHPYRGGEYCD